MTFTKFLLSNYLDFKETILSSEIILNKIFYFTSFVAKLKFELSDK